LEHSDDAERRKVVTGPRKRRSAKGGVLGDPIRFEHRGEDLQARGDGEVHQLGSCIAEEIDEWTSPELQGFG
jgi:hypothetical protein